MSPLPGFGIGMTNDVFQIDGKQAGLKGVVVDLQTDYDNTMK